MTLSYEDIFSDFLGYITDFGFTQEDVQDVYEMMREYINKAMSKPYVRRLFSSSVLEDEIQTFNFEMSNPVEESADADFVREVLAKGMIIEWLQPQVKSKLLTAQMFSGKEVKYYSQSQMLSEMRGLLEDAQLEQRKIIRDRGYIYNPYLEE